MARLICLLSVLAALCVCARGPAALAMRPGRRLGRELHLTWRRDPHTTMTVQWVTARPLQAKMALRVGSRWRIVNGRESADGGVWRNVVDVSGLSPGRSYRYLVRTGSRTWSRESEFATAVGPVGSELRFDAFADQGDCESFTEACRVMAGIAADRPQFVLAAGDLSYGTEHGIAADDRWANEIEVWSTRAPIMPSWGNHEAEYPTVDPLSGFKRRFALPGNEDWYSFDAGPVHFVTLPERYVPVSSGTPYHRFLKADLEQAASRAGTRFIVAFGQRPVYSTGTRHGSEQRFQRHLVALFDQFHVSLVITGHEHHYERTKAMRAGAANTSGTVYVVTGGGGADIYDDFGPEQSWDAVRTVTHEWLSVTVAGNQMQLRAVAPGGRVVDQVTIPARPSAS